MSVPSSRSCNTTVLQQTAESRSPVDASQLQGANMILVSRRRAGRFLRTFSDCVYTARCTRDTRLLCVRLRNGQSCGVRREAVVSFPRRRQSSGLRAKRPSIAFQLVIPAEREDNPDVRRRTVRCGWGVPKVCSFRSSGREGGRTKKLFGGSSSCWPGAMRAGSAAKRLRGTAACPGLG